MLYNINGIMLTVVYLSHSEYIFWTHAYAYESHMTTQSEDIVACLMHVWEQ